MALSRRLRAALVAASLVAVACSASSASPSQPRASEQTASLIVPGSAPAPTASSVATASRPPFDPSRVSVTLQPFATVPGGPLAIAAPDDGSGRLFVASQDGRAWVVDRNGLTKSTPLLDISRAITTGGERGLLGIAPHPQFAQHPIVFVDYTDLDGNTVVASYRISASDPDRLDPSTALAWLQVKQPYPNHNGGAVVFGPDGDLYVSLGDGGSGGDPQGNGQNLDTLLGKILRIAVDGASDTSPPYAIPRDNPFADRSSARAEIWLYGLRNPWRMSFDRATGDLWIGDVGQNAWEEVDVARAGVGGLDFGWNRMEGAHCYQPSEGCDRSGLTMPVAEYGHDQGCVVIGGVVYRGGRFPVLGGAYLYADYCSGTMWALDATATSASASPPAAVRVGAGGGDIVAFGEDESGEVYVASLSGQISMVVAATR
jgi:glucose/arabinose dehydrogenase